MVAATDILHTFASESRATAKFDKNNFKHTDMADKKKSTVGDLKQDKNNYRKHSEANKKKIKKSIDECGLGRSVVVDADGVLVAGNGVSSVLPEDTPVRIIETDGTELVVVKRTDLHTGDEKRKKLALADNATSDDVEWNFDAMAADGWDGEALAGWGVDLPSAANNYSRKIEIPIYEPTGKEVAVSELTDTTKYDQLVTEIKAAKLDATTEAFLMAAASRHIVFDYAKIGDFYANASAEVQELMERSALVIIDFEKAIENGFVKMTDELTKMCEAQMMETEGEE